MVASIRVLAVAAVFLLGLAAACTHESAPISRQSSAVQISDFGQIAGRWEGVMRSTPKTGNDDWVTVRIGDDGA